MTFYPYYDAFCESFTRNAAQPVWTTLPADLETPVSAWLKLTDGDTRYSFLLESVEGGSLLGRYSFVGLMPDMVWRLKDGVAEINRAPEKNPDNFVRDDRGSPLESLRALHRETRMDMPDSLPPSAAGLFGFMAYDVARLVENLPPEKPDAIGIPDSVFIRPGLVAVFDNVTHMLTLVAPVWPKAGEEKSASAARAAWDTAVRRLEQAVERLKNPVRLPQEGPVPERLDLKRRFSSDAFQAAVAQAQEYILAGDIFQAVLSQRFVADFPLPALSLYRSLRRLNPSPFLFYLDFGDFSLVGSSPEILVRVRAGTVTIRPIAGTRRRGQTAQEDQSLAEELLADEKERAEHLMLLDLGRNDVGRVSAPGSVCVTESYRIERYSHVMHIVSNVEGRLAPGLDSLDALLSGFPAGTVTGAPKIRAMEIINELEPEKRGFYAGCVGYLGADGSVDSCITLRTALVKDGRLYLHAGAGIVADSVPQNEDRECHDKARALVRAAEDALQQTRKNRNLREEKKG